MRSKIFVLLFALLVPFAAQAKILDIKEVTSPGGLKVWLVEDHSLAVVALTFAFRTGAAIDTPDKQGVTQLLSNTLDEGFGDMPSKDFQGALRDNAIDLSFSFSRDQFYGQMRTLTRHLPEAEKLMKGAIMGPRFDTEAVDRMRAANIARIKSNLSDSDWIAARILNDLMYQGHPYAMNTGGTVETLTTLNAADLRMTRANHFVRERLVIGMTGDITPEQAGQMADMLFGGLPQKADVPLIPDQIMPQAGQAVYYAQDIPQTSLSVAWPGISVHDPDYYASVVMNYIFGGGGFSSRLMAEIREKRGLTYGIYSSAYNLDHADRLVVSASLLPGNVVKTLDLIGEVADAMKTTPVDAGTLKAAQDYLTGSLPLQFSSTQRTAGALVELQLNDRPITALDDYAAKILAVTPADIQRVAERIFAVNPIVVAVGAKPEGLTMLEWTSIPNAETVSK
ncbi:MAG TPA: pitrilysin family protein [Alphaproteobacteria bacterium]